MNDRYSRQSGIIPQERLAEQRVTVVGIGAVGRQVAVQLAAIGVRHLTLFDFDKVDESNLTTQAYRRGDVGVSKVVATSQAVLEIDPTIHVVTIEDRFRAKYLVGTCLFICVDSITSRQAIWRSVGTKVSFWADVRIRAEVIRVLTATDADGRKHYGTTLFSQAEAATGSCNSRGTIYTACAGAALLTHQFARWLRGIPCEKDTVLSLLGMELVTS